MKHENAILVAFVVAVMLGGCKRGPAACAENENEEVQRRRGEEWHFCKSENLRRLVVVIDGRLASYSAVGTDHELEVSKLRNDLRFCSGTRHSRASDSGLEVGEGPCGGLTWQAALAARPRLARALAPATVTHIVDTHSCLLVEQLLPGLTTPGVRIDMNCAGQPPSLALRNE